MPVTFTSNMQRYQGILQSKFREVESLYYTEVDELTHKLSDLGIDEVPELILRTSAFTFVHDWLQGRISTQDVVDILDKIDLGDVAEKQITRPLINFMFKKEESAEYVKAVVANLKEHTVPAYKKYLELMQRYFEKLAENEGNVVPLTWGEVVITPDGAMRNKFSEYTFNQTIKRLEYFFRDELEDGAARVGDNMIVIDEELEGTRANYWIFGPKSYIRLICTLYDIRDEMKLEDTPYIGKLIEEYAYAAKA